MFSCLSIFAHHIIKPKRGIIMYNNQFNNQFFNQQYVTPDYYYQNLNQITQYQQEQRWYPDRRN